MEQAYKHLENEQWTDARRAFESELAAHPKNLEARYNLALLLKRAGHSDRERTLYEENIRIGWHLPSIANLASIYTLSGDKEQAKALLEKAVKHFKYDAIPAYLLADIEAEAGHPAKAEKWYKVALKADRLNAFAHIRYARFLSRENRSALALKHAYRAVQLQPECSACLDILGFIQVRNKQYKAALKSYQKSLALNPNHQTRQKLINALHRLGKHARAKRMQLALDRWLQHAENTNKEKKWHSTFSTRWL